MSRCTKAEPKQHPPVYESPRWSGEILDCAMPMTFDTSSACSYDCLYCFAYFQKSHSCSGYKAHQVRTVNPDRVKAIFDRALGLSSDPIPAGHEQFLPLLRARKVVQWGALSDQFDGFERQHRVTLGLLTYFDKIDYPLSFSTKGVWWTKDSKYTDLFANHRHNWHLKVSIISNDALRCRKIEQGVSSPQNRIEAIRRIAELGIHTTLRYRPYILGLSNDWPEVFEAAADAGADSVSTEFFCMESRADPATKARYQEISDVVGYDIHEFYMKNSKQQGYKRLNDQIKRPIFTEMKRTAHKLGMRFHVSDALCRDLNDDGINCCGVPADWNDQKSNFGGAIMIAKRNGEVRWEDIAPDIETLFPFLWHRAHHFNTSSNLRRAQYGNVTMAEWIRHVWNSPKMGASPAKMYGPLLRPIGRENGNIVYKYIGPK